MTHLEHQGAHVDHCRRCGGVFLDRGEASRTMSPDADPDAWVKSRIATPLGPSKLRCPHDRALLVAYQLSFGSATVEVDVCSSCRGLWLDAKEPAKLRAIAEQARLVAEGGSRELHSAAAALHQMPAAAPPRIAGAASGSAAPVVSSPELAAELAPKPGVASYFFQVFTGFPIEVYNPVKEKPVVVITLLVLLAMVFTVQVLAALAGGEDGARAFNDGLWLVPAEFLRGERVWTVFTCTFLHGGLLHFLGNAYFLWIFGDNVEEHLGHKRFLVLYLVSGLFASLLHVAFNAGSDIPCLGASGAIAGLMGAYLSIFPKTKLWVVVFFIRFRIGVMYYLGFWVLIQVVSAAMGAPGVAWYAHIGGFLAGVVLAPFMRKRA